MEGGVPGGHNLEAVKSGSLCQEEGSLEGSLGRGRRDRGRKKADCLGADEGRLGPRAFSYS